MTTGSLSIEPATTPALPLSKLDRFPADPGEEDYLALLIRPSPRANRQFLFDRSRFFHLWTPQTKKGSLSSDFRSVAHPQQGSYFRRNYGEEHISTTLHECSCCVALRPPWADLMRRPMNGLCTYPIIPIMVAGFPLALVIWVWRRYDVLPSRQVEIAFLFGGFMLWVGITIGLYSSFQVPVRLLAQQNINPPLAATPLPDNRAFLEKFFGARRPSSLQSSRPALAYAAPESDVLDNARGITSGPLLGLDERTAVYDISAHTVYLPDGTELEAHSGQRDRLDNPRYVHEHMRGATPPNVYELALREKPFHGVQALRLNPVDKGNVFGRTGLLAHTYMLGPKGQSNGCVVFKNYSAFLQAFQNGGLKRLIVVDRVD